MCLSMCYSGITQSIKVLTLLFLFLPGRGRADGRRITLSSLALDNNVSKTGPQYQRKKPKLNVRTWKKSISVSAICLFRTETVSCRFSLILAVLCLTFIPISSRRTVHTDSPYIRKILFTSIPIYRREPCFGKKKQQHGVISIEQSVF